MLECVWFFLVIGFFNEFFVFVKLRGSSECTALLLGKTAGVPWEAADAYHFTSHLVSA